MNCFYCDKIAAVEPAYAIAAAAFDLGSEAPRCGRHWRYVCDQCGQPAHFMAVAFCPEQGKSFCARCATSQREVEAPFWAWKYYFELQSPWSGQWLPTLDRLEFEGRLPADLPGRSEELWLARYPETPAQWRSAREYTDADVQANWNANAQRWDAGYDADGDRNRRYQSDEPMLALLGEVHGLRVLDAGSGNGYLCRKLARAGALMTGVELDGYLETTDLVPTIDVAVLVERVFFFVKLHQLGFNDYVANSAQVEFHVFVHRDVLEAGLTRIAEVLRGVGVAEDLDRSAGDRRVAELVHLVVDTPADGRDAVCTPRCARRRSGTWPGSPRGAR